MARVGGNIRFSINGAQYLAKGTFEYNLGSPKRSEVIGSDGRIHGYKEEGQAPFVSGSITDDVNLSLSDLTSLTDAEVVLNLSNGKHISLKNAFFAEDGTGSTEEGEIKVKFIGESAEEFKS